MTAPNEILGKELFLTGFKCFPGFVKLNFVLNNKKKFVIIKSSKIFFKLILCNKYFNVKKKQNEYSFPINIKCKLITYNDEFDLVNYG